MHTHTYVHRHAYTHACMHTHTYTQARVHACMHTGTQTRTQTHSSQFNQARPTSSQSVLNCDELIDIGTFWTKYCTCPSVHGGMVREPWSSRSVIKRFYGLCATQRAHPPAHLKKKKEKTKQYKNKRKRKEKREKKGKRKQKDRAPIYRTNSI